LVVGGLEVVVHAEALAAGEHAALRERRELAGLDDRLRLGARVDVRHHDGLRAPIERAIDRGVVVVHHPDDRGLAPEVAGPRQVAEVGVVDPAVLALQPDAIHVERGEVVDVAVETSRDTLISRIARLRLTYAQGDDAGPSHVFFKTSREDAAEALRELGRKEVTFYDVVAVVTPPGLLPRCYEAAAE